MTEAELLKLVDSYKEHILNEDEGDAEFRERMLLGLCRDIEREARSSAVKAIFATASAVDERVDVRRVLVEHENRVMVGDGIAATAAGGNLESKS